MLADHAMARTRQTPKARMSGFFTASVMVAPPASASSMSAAPWRRELRSTTSVRTDRPMGSIISVVAVFDTHIDRKPVASISPSTIRRGCTPTRASVASAMRRCRFHFSIAMAIRKPPRNRNTMELA